MTLNVKLVVAPVLSIVRPVYGPSLLQAKIERRNLTCEIHYANISFAEKFDIGIQEWLSGQCPSHCLIGEWLFSDALFERNCNEHRDSLFLEKIGSFLSEEMKLKLNNIKKNISKYSDSEATEIAKGNPQIIGFSSSFEQNCASLLLAKKIKSILPETIIVFGGANCAEPMGSAILNTFHFVDYVFSGDSEETFTKFVLEKSLNKNRTKILFSGRKSSIQGNRPANLDTLPEPEYRDFFNKIYSSHLRKYILPGLVIESSRGCWWGEIKHCTFCGLNADAMKYSIKSPEKVIDEINNLSKKWNIKRFLAVDNIMAKEHINSIFKEIAKLNESYSFFYEIKANHKAEHLKILKNAGVTTLQPGIESLDDYTLKLMDKGITTLQNILFLKNALEQEISCIWNIIVGYPQELVSSYKNLIDMIPVLEHLPPPTSLGNVRIDRFSPIFNNPQKFGFGSISPVPAYRFIYEGLDDSNIADLAYFFEDPSFNTNYSKYIEKLSQLVLRWRNNYFSDSPPQLTMLKIANVAVIKDTRTIGAGRKETLDPLSTAILIAFREIRNVSGVLDSVSTDWQVEIESVEFCYEKLLNKNLLLEIGKSCLSLVCDRSAGSEPRNTESIFPGGEVRIEEFNI
ncbi:RiPP maturation radical SAM C-methyltransferase [uncultured Pseudoalteromonas sp.]|uniref:RiPP maturation radical SAM C-methyltransferase n=1 Tax=uncultured Pseudoalteromonas sp. TaxID=114053 RepID=UPI0025CCFC83|nr:RiPP maturation radical SAM C-methyltransferase [uncultured Pseudoalteromonas sp.]|tara:strand:+ start:4406 stop:6286 length:1881 start_codon:yes stop_codon:yes gene_type:complete